MSVNPISLNAQGTYAYAPQWIQKEDNSSVFKDCNYAETTNTTEGKESLEAQFKRVQDEQGIIGKAWNGIKNFFNIGLSSNDVKDAIQQYENGNISYEEVQNTIESFDNKQEGAVNIIANSATGLATAGLAVATGGIGAIAVGAALGGAAKAGIKTLDRATNNVDGDALNAKQIAKDGITGAIDGAISTVTAGIIKAPVAGQAVSTAIKQGAIQGARAGVISGAVTGAGNYTVEAIFEEDVDFTIDGLLKETTQNALAGGIMGGAMGGITGGIRQNNLNNKIAKTQSLETPASEVQTPETKPSQILDKNVQPDTTETQALVQKGVIDSDSQTQYYDTQNTTAKLDDGIKSIEADDIKGLPEPKEIPAETQLAVIEGDGAQTPGAIEAKTNTTQIESTPAAETAPKAETTVAKSAAAQVDKGLTQEDIKNIEIYKNGENYDRINTQMREGVINSRNKGVVDAIDKAFETDGITLDSDTILYRGVRREYSWSDGSFHSEVYDNLKPGDILVDDAFISTSTLEEVARSAEYMGYADGFNPTEPYGYLLEIHTPKGTKVLDIESTITQNGGKCMALNESELLLPHGTSFKVREIQGDTIILDILENAEK